MKANLFNMTLFPAYILTLFSLPAQALLPAMSLDINMVCHTMGQAVAEIQAERQEGVADEDNEGMQFLVDLTGKTEDNLITQVELFLDKTQRLPAHWTGALYTHACLYDYTAQLSQIALMSSMVKARCNMSQADTACIQKIFSGLPLQQAI